jgi:hypothetical protein
VISTHTISSVQCFKRAAKKPIKLLCRGIKNILSG